MLRRDICLLTPTCSKYCTVPSCSEFRLVSDVSSSPALYTAGSLIRQSQYNGCLISPPQPLTRGTVTNIIRNIHINFSLAALFPTKYFRQKFPTEYFLSLIHQNVSIKNCPPKILLKMSQSSRYYLKDICIIYLV